MKRQQLSRCTGEVFQDIRHLMQIDINPLGVRGGIGLQRSILHEGVGSGEKQRNDVVILAEVEPDAVVDEANQGVETRGHPIRLIGD